MGYQEIFHKITARSRKNKFYSFLLKASGREFQNKKWVFILGSYNSGTTLLNKVLSQHPSISGLPDEGVMLTDQLVRPEDFAWQRMWHKCEEQILASATQKMMDPGVIRRHWSHFYDNKEFLLEKSISNVLRIPFFEKEFQPAYYIHIVRNGYAVAEGIRRKARVLEGNQFYKAGSKYPIEDCAQQWVRHLDVVEENKSNLKNFMEISYEAFVDDPFLAVHEITHFLNLGEYDKPLLNKSFSIHEKDSKITNMNETSFNNLTTEETEVINRIAGKHLTRNGYELR